MKRKMTIFNDAYLLNHGTEDRKPHIQCVLLIKENTLDMGFVALGAVVDEIRVVEDVVLESQHAAARCV